MIVMVVLDELFRGTEEGEVVGSRKDVSKLVSKLWKCWVYLYLITLSGMGMLERYGGVCSYCIFDFGCGSGCGGLRTFASGRAYT